MTALMNRIRARMFRARDTCSCSCPLLVISYLLSGISSFGLSRLSGLFRLSGSSMYALSSFFFLAAYCILLTAYYIASTLTLTFFYGILIKCEVFEQYDAPHKQHTNQHYPQRKEAFLSHNPDSGWDSPSS